jgi:hypothetical protein
MTRQNISGSALDQLKECHDIRRVRPHRNTLIVLVGHDEDKILKTLNLYQSKLPSIPHSLVVVCNGSNPNKLPKGVLPENAVGPVIYRPNTGWDIAMYAEAVLRYKFRHYWFMNDDVIRIANGNYLSEFKTKVRRSKVGVVGVQAGSPRNFRTTYFGCSRLFFLAWHVAIHYRVLQKRPDVVKRQDRRAAIKKRVPGYVQAKEFELYNLTFAKVCGFKPQWLRNSSHFIDANANAKSVFRRPAAGRITYDTPREGLASFGDHAMEDLWAGKEELTIRHIIDIAEKNRPIRY